MNTNPSKARAIVARLALAAIGAGTAYGLTATAVDLSPRTEPERAGITATAVDLTPAPTPDAELFGISARGAD